MNRLAIYCGSATPTDPVYVESAKAVGRALAERGIGVVYGGGRLGLMGAVRRESTQSPLEAMFDFPSIKATQYRRLAQSIGPR